MNKNVWYYVISDDGSQILVGPEESIERLQSALEEAIDDGDVDLDSGEEEFEVLALIGTMSATKKTKIQTKFISDESNKKGK